MNPEKRKTSYFESGQEYFKKGKYAEATIEFRNAIKIDPQFAKAHYQLAKVDLAIHEWSEAYAELTKALEIDPTRTDARLDRARLELAAGGREKENLAKAEDDANSILKQDPKNTGAHEILGSAFVAEKKYDQALQEFYTLTQLEPNKAQSYVDIALVDVALQHLREAEQGFTKAIEVEPKVAGTYVDLANFYRLQKRLPEAEQVLERGARQNPGSIPIYMTWAATLDVEQKRTQAESVLQSLRNEQPKSGAAAMAIGDYYVQRKMSDQALEEFRRGLSLEPNSLAIEERIEDRYLSMGQIKPAAEMDAIVAKQAPHDIIARSNHGRLLLAQGKAQDAVNYLQKAAADLGDSPQIHYYLAMAYLRNGNPGQANAELQNTLQISSGWTIALEGLVQLNLLQNNAAVAQIYAQELVQKNSADVSYRLLLGNIELQEGRSDQAQEQFMAAKQLAPHDPAVHLGLGHYYAASKKFPEAEREYQAAVDAAPQNVEALNQFAGFLVGRGELARASSIIERFLTQNPGSAGAHLILGSLERNQKNFSGARSETEQTIQLDPKLTSAYLQLAQISRDQGDNQGAIQAYQKALALEPNSALVMAALGGIYLDQGDLAKASELFQQALSANPNFAPAANNLAWIYAEQGTNLDVALGLAQKAIAQSPDVAAYSDTLAWVMYKKGIYDSALPLLEKCVRKVPDSPEYHYHLGMLLLAKGQKANAATELQLALQLKLDAADAASARVALAHVD